MLHFIFTERLHVLLNGNGRTSWLQKPCLFCVAVMLPFFGLTQLVEVSDALMIQTDHTGGYLGTGLSFADFNGDGKDDLSFGHHNGLLRFYEGTGMGFEEIELQLEFPAVESKAILWADIDNDGDQDLLVTCRLAPNKIYINQGDLTMLDVSASCGIAQDNRRSFGACYGDYDNDGLLDVFIANYSYSSDLPGNELYRNLGGGLFEDVTAQMGLGGSMLQCFQGQWMDHDRDGTLDLHVIRDREIYSNLFYENGALNGEGVFQEIASEIGLDVGINCMSTSPCDFDRDGDLDLFLSGGIEGNVFFENNGEGAYFLNDNPDVIMNETCWAASWMDVDCNGWEDLHVTTGIAAFTDYPSVLFQYPNAYDALFMNEMGELSEEEGTLDIASSLGFSTATGDLNQDGFPDLVSHSIGGTAKVWNGTPNDNNWVKIRPVGITSNRDGVGTKIELWIEGVPFYRETYCGENYLGQNSRWEHFGLGVEMSIDSMQVEWSSGIVDVYYNVMANQSLVITEGETAIQCQGSCLGCTYTVACNYNADAQDDDGSCDFSCWFDENVCANGAVWNASLQQCVENCPSDVDGDGLVNIEDLLLLLLSFATWCPN